MLSKTLTTLLLTTAALAAPAPAPEPDTSSYPNPNPTIDMVYANIPSSILSVLETAIPTTWLESMYSDPAFRSEEASDIMHGTYPAWYNSLPQSVKAWETSAAMAGASGSPYPYSSFDGSMVPHPTPLIGSGGFNTSGVVSSTPHSSSVTATASTETSTATETTTKGGSGGSSSSSSSGSGSTSVSTAGAPAATGGVAMSLAGAAGILGLALAL